MLRKVEIKDAQSICDIYNYYVKNTIVTFEEDEVSIEDMQNRIINIGGKYPWLVFEKNNEILGYAYAGEWKSRCAYRYSAEISVYIKNGFIGNKTGSLLYSALIDSLSKSDIHSLIAGISLPNEISIAIHEKFGFEKIGQFKEVGFKFNTWIDVGYWEKIL
ncbi:MAG: N-acetyltransferase [Bacteroidia bacterium]|nr:N-acetyltransferase [Bacteroidia bacterium]